MAVSQNILGMNARNYLYIRKYNKRIAKKIADDKFLTKKRLMRYTIPTPKLLTFFRTRNDIASFSWESFPSNGFALKPARGWAGGGILVFKKWLGQSGITVSGKKYTLADIETHILNILDGAFSLQYLPDYALIEERVILSPFYKKLCPIGLTDIRVIVLKNIPVMAMMRVPTEESNWTANYTQGAIILGIDMRTGITSFSYKKHGKPPRFLPGTKIKTRGIKIPNWDKILLLAARAQQVSKLGYAGIDIVVDQEKGPMVLEVNARPGLGIQNANRSSLRTRLERIENMKSVSPERGVEVARSLFAQAELSKISTHPTIVGIIEQVVLEGQNGIKAIEAKIDSGAHRTSIDSQLASELGFEKNNSLIPTKSAIGKQYRTTIKITFYLRGKKITTIASVSDRKNLRYPMLIGRRDLKGFLIDPTKNTPEV